MNILKSTLIVHLPVIIYNVELEDLTKRSLWVRKQAWLLEVDQMQVLIVHLLEERA